MHVIELHPRKAPRPFNTKGTVQEVAYEQQEDDIYEDPDSLLMVTHGSQFSTYSIVPSWVSGCMR